MRRASIAFTGTSVASAAVLGVLAGFVLGSASARQGAPVAPMSCLLRPAPAGDLRPAGFEPLRGLCIVAGGGR